jgi:hypothetical protein
MLLLLLAGSLWLVAPAAAAAPGALELHPNVSNQINLNDPASGASSPPAGATALLGRGTADLQACGELCASYENPTAGPHLRQCQSFTRFANATSASSAGDCWGQMTSVWLPLSGVVAGVPVVDSGRVNRPCTPTAGKSSFECSHNGVCSAAGVCECTQGWTGRRCETLDVLPVDRKKYGFLPTDDKGQNFSSWGGSILSEGGVWHMWAARMVNYWCVQTHPLTVITQACRRTDLGLNRACAIVRLQWNRAVGGKLKDCPRYRHRSPRPIH